VKGEGEKGKNEGGDGGKKSMEVDGTDRGGGRG